MKSRRGRPPHDDVLTPMEWRVLHAAQHGLTNRAIAQGLDISANGVKYHMANILSKLGLANREALKSWFRVPRGSALAEGAQGLGYESLIEDTVMTTGKESTPLVQCLGQVSRTVSSLQKSIEFYRDTLGIPHLYSFGNIGFFDLSGTRLFLNETEELNKEESILYLKVDDIVQACISLEETGVDVIKQPHLIHTHEDGSEEWMAFFEDPEGRPLGLMSLAKKAG